LLLTEFLAVSQRHRSAPAGAGDYRPRPALTGTDQPGLFYDVFDKNFLNILPFWAFQYKMSTKNVIKQHGPVGAGLVPDQSCQGLSVPVPVGAGWCRDR
jgi:hypothetical protein